MKWWLGPAILLCLAACKDPNSFEPFDPTKPDPPSPPVLSSPANGWMSDRYYYPQDVTFDWSQVPGAQFYQVEVYRDSLMRSQYLVYAAERVNRPPVMDSIPTWGIYYWRVRAASRNWNDYTEWSAALRFSLPNPAR